MKKLNLATTLAMLLFLAGCGGPSVTARRAPGPAAWAPRVGDVADYVEETSMRVPSIAGSSGQGSGTRKCRVVASADHGRPVPPYIVRTFDLKEELLDRVGGLSSSNTVITWLGSDRSGNLYLLGESLDGTTWDVVTDPNPPVYVPSDLKLGASWKYVAHLASGNTECCDKICVGTEELVTPAGRFQALKVKMAFSRTGMEGGTTSMSGHVWYARSVPCVFQLKTECGFATGAGGIPGEGRVVDTLQSFRLAR